MLHGNAAPPSRPCPAGAASPHTNLPCASPGASAPSAPLPPPSARRCLRGLQPHPVGGCCQPRPAAPHMHPHPSAQPGSQPVPAKHIASLPHASVLKHNRSGTQHTSRSSPPSKAAAQGGPDQHRARLPGGGHRGPRHPRQGHKAPAAASTVQPHASHPRECKSERGRRRRSLRGRRPISTQRRRQR